jgi:hypothetical protein
MARHVRCNESEAHEPFLPKTHTEARYHLFARFAGARPRALAARLLFNAASFFAGPAAAFFAGALARAPPLSLSLSHALCICVYIYHMVGLNTGPRL